MFIQSAAPGRPHRAVHDARSHAPVGPARARVRQCAIRGAAAARSGGVCDRCPRCRLGRLRPRSGHRSGDRPTLQRLCHAAPAHPADQQGLAGLQPAASSLLRAVVVDAHLGDLQWPLRIYGRRPPQKHRAGGQAGRRCDARARDRASERIEGRARAVRPRQPPGSRRTGCSRTTSCCSSAICWRSISTTSTPGSAPSRRSPTCPRRATATRP